MRQPTDQQPDARPFAEHPDSNLATMLLSLPVRLPDPIVALAPTALVLLVLATNDADVGPTPSRAVNAGLMTAGAFALVVRRRSPVTVAVMTLLSGQLPLAVALYGLAARRGPTRTLAVLAVLAEIRLTIPFDLSDLTTLSTLANVIEDPLVYGAVPLALGLAAHQRARAVTVLAERNRLLEEARRHAEERAVAAERARLAREMHDVVSNRVSLITLHAGACRHAAADDPHAVRETLGLIRALGLQALTELRGLLGVLTPASDQGPSLRGLPALVDESRQAGLVVGLTVTGPADGLPAPGPAVQYAAYRIVQEALTNAHKHAPEAEVAVTVEVRRDGLRLAVVNSPGGTREEPELPSGGHGLDGMRTRADDLGGTLDAGPTPDGGFAVRARLPLAAPEAARADS
ncbi:sensor histidine kinase [Kitasatospora aureofaciens]|uniref:sensor histidine kinase n=1 Tax=Kitasatospora aureofaciens TaxID=1894 RepID=UPI001C48FA82|nr:sensor histidine kinase [Kitasatospora aureofaciens]MBV6699517.1 sensor histidine kinase [Kitasatospora aureofaciens]